MGTSRKGGAQAPLHGTHRKGALYENRYIGLRGILGSGVLAVVKVGDAMPHIPIAGDNDAHCVLCGHTVPEGHWCCDRCLARLNGGIE